MVNENSIKTLVESFLLAEFYQEAVYKQQQFKQSLKYAIHVWSEKKLQNNLFDGNDYIVDFPDRLLLKDFYKQVWQYMFPNEDDTIHDNLDTNK